MSSEQLLLVMTAVLAVVAACAAFVAVRAARHGPPATETAPRGDSSVPELPVASPKNASLPMAGGAAGAPQDTERPVPVIVEGRVIVPPTSRQIAEVTLGRPLVRLSVVSHGLAHALRPESRDRIVALMRREFQSRRRQRKRAAKRAARLDVPVRRIDRSTVTTEAWLGELPASTRSATEHRAAES